MYHDVEVTFKNGSTKKFTWIRSLDYESIPGSLVLIGFYGEKTVIERKAICYVSEK